MSATTPKPRLATGFVLIVWKNCILNLKNNEEMTPTLFVSIGNYHLNQEPKFVDKRCAERS
jgi:hypothetical protein